jgi:hypothetical protein
MKKAKESKWLPAPRECATLTVCDFKMYLIGGLNFDACKEMIEGRISGENIIWERIPYSSAENIQGRQCHTSICYNNKIYTFGGCFMFNRKRQLRECTNQLLEYDIYEKRMDIVKTKGYSVSARKNHCAAVFRKSMVVYGGQIENGTFDTEMIVYHIESSEWVKVNLKQAMVPFT